MLEAIEREILTNLQQYAEGRRNDVARGAETHELAALLVDKYCEGLSNALYIVGLNSAVRSEGDRLVKDIDPDFDTHRQARWAARPARISMDINDVE